MLLRLTVPECPMQHCHSLYWQKWPQRNSGWPTQLRGDPGWWATNSWWTWCHGEGCYQVTYIHIHCCFCLIYLFHLVDIIHTLAPMQFLLSMTGSHELCWITFHAIEVWHNELWFAVRVVLEWKAMAITLWTNSLSTYILRLCMLEILSSLPRHQAQTKGKRPCVLHFKEETTLQEHFKVKYYWTLYCCMSFYFA